MTIIEELHNRFPSTKIFTSSLLPRGDLFVKNNVQYVNDFLSGVCSGAPFLIFIRNNNISRHYLPDNKHVDEFGFKILLSNIRFTLFGKVPYLRRRNSYHDYN